MDEEDLEKIGEQLYNLIHPKHKDNAGKLTGEVTSMLCYLYIWNFFFHYNIDYQHYVWTPQNQSSPACLCVSGMLLELPGPVLGQMLQDEATLTAAVEKALRALQLAQEPR